jgi:hypothetical protein
LTGSTQFNGFQSGDFNAFQQSFALTRPPFGFIRPLLANGARPFWRKLAAMDLETKNGNRHGGGRAYRSRVEPFVDFIRAQRQQRKTWQEIAEQLRDEKNCIVTFQGLHQFYRRYLKRQARPNWENEIATPSVAKLLTVEKPFEPLLAETPPARPFRRPNPDNINLNDPTKI